MFRLVAGGEPVTLEQVADATGRPVQDVREALTALPDTEFDDTGRIVGWGITQRETHTGSTSTASTCSPGVRRTP